MVALLCVESDCCFSGPFGAPPQKKSCPGVHSQPTEKKSQSKLMHPSHVDAD